MEKSWPFNNGEKYGQEAWAEYFDHVYRSGISVDDSGVMELKVTASGTTVSVAPGFAIISGFAYKNDSQKEITVTPDSNYVRIDRVVLRLDTASMSIISMVKKGIASSSPKPPDITRSGTVYELSLAQIRVTTSGTVTVTDERSDTQMCGAIRPKNITELEAMMKNNQKRFEEWFDAQQAKGWREIYIQENTPEKAVSGSIWM